ncbi:hypothetical protein O3M35_008977 [Rhynocoris fuscipes]|uniref:Uncharacterized protein n=1 Tax=Rhynocoris fuscipes TaxID=488301 RepID=A0AAW1D7A5_9HEMI
MIKRKPYNYTKMTLKINKLQNKIKIKKFRLATLIRKKLKIIIFLMPKLIKLIDKLKSILNSPKKFKKIRKNLVSVSSKVAALIIGSS